MQYQFLCVPIGPNQARFPSKFLSTKWRVKNSGRPKMEKKFDINRPKKTQQTHFSSRTTTISQHCRRLLLLLSIVWLFLCIAQWGLLPSEVLPGRDPLVVHRNSHKFHHCWSTSSSSTIPFGRFSCCCCAPTTTYSVMGQKNKDPIALLEVSWC